MAEEQKTLSPEERQQREQAWIRESFQKANGHLASKGILPQKVKQTESRFLAPLVSLWRITAKVEGHIKDFWVISGDLPTDHVEVNAAGDAREALRHFSMQWQLKAENIMRGPQAKDEVQVKFANMLVHRGEILYRLFEDDRLWGQQA
ncbi:DUF4826 family protein [Gallaecimonas sp. GXIMD4217]|uniref:DUF4826 family protein n=1 Tax=Gallaecimonas sp. GXIMD4217 TaxID=3131927 RepID=UPI00311B148C